MDVISLMKNYMQQKKLTQRKLAEMLGADPFQLCRWLGGKHMPCRAWQMQITRVLGTGKTPVVGRLERVQHKEAE